MIDVNNITNYNLTHAQLEKYLLFWVFVAGHNAKSTAKSIDKFLTNIDLSTKYLYESPFKTICSTTWDIVIDILSKSGLGCWKTKSKTIHQLIYSNLNLKTCTVEDLEEIYGIGPKTARCFIMHTRKNVRLAGLDTHILKFLKSKGIDVPKTTPTGKKYLKLEQDFLRLCDEANKSPAEFDLEIWRRYSNKE